MCLALNDGLIDSMRVSREMLSTYTNRPIADNPAQKVLTAMEAESRQPVDKIAGSAIEYGATRYRGSAEHGRMYCDCFTDLDGHQ